MASQKLFRKKTFFLEHPVLIIWLHDNDDYYIFFSCFIVSTYSLHLQYNMNIMINIKYLQYDDLLFSVFRREAISTVYFVRLSVRYNRKARCRKSETEVLAMRAHCAGVTGRTLDVNEVAKGFRSVIEMTLPHLITNITIIAQTTFCMTMILYR